MTDSNDLIIQINHLKIQMIELSTQMIELKKILKEQKKSEDSNKLFPTQGLSIPFPSLSSSFGEQPVNFARLGGPLPPVQQPANPINLGQWGGSLFPPVQPTQRVNLGQINRVSSSPSFCKNGHPLALSMSNYESLYCDKCGATIQKNTEIMSCRACDYDLCSVCINNDRGILKQ